MKPDYSETVLRYKDTVYKIAFAQCGSYSDADDVFQEVFLKLLQHTGGFKSEEHLKAWLIKVTVNCCRLLHRSERFRRKAELDEDLPDGTEFDAEGGCVLAAVMALPSKYRPVVMMYYFEDMSCREIAAALGIKEKTVHTRLHRARERLREDLREVWCDE